MPRVQQLRRRLRACAACIAEGAPAGTGPVTARHVWRRKEGQQQAQQSSIHSAPAQLLHQRSMERGVELQLKAQPAPMASILQQQCQKQAAANRGSGWAGHLCWRAAAVPVVILSMAPAATAGPALPAGLAARPTAPRPAALPPSCLTSPASICLHPLTMLPPRLPASSRRRRGPHLPGQERGQLDWPGPVAQEVGRVPAGPADQRGEQRREQGPGEAALLLLWLVASTVITRWQWPACGASAPPACKPLLCRRAADAMP